MKKYKFIWRYGDFFFEKIDWKVIETSKYCFIYAINVVFYLQETITTQLNVYVSF